MNERSPEWERAVSVDYENVDRFFFFFFYFLAIQRRVDVPDVVWAMNLAERKSSSPKIRNITRSVYKYDDLFLNVIFLVISNECKYFFSVVNNK